MIAAVYKLTSENGQTHNGSHIYTHDRHCHAVLPFPAEWGYSSHARRRPIAWFRPYAMERVHPDRERGLGTRLAKHNMVWERVSSMPTSEKGTTSLQRTRNLSLMCPLFGGSTVHMQSHTLPLFTAFLLTGAGRTWASLASFAALFALEGGSVEEEEG